MAKKYRRRIFRRNPSYYRVKHKRGFPSIASIMSIAGPQLAINSGQMGTYPAIGNALSGNYQEAMWNLGANEVMAFTGFDVGKGTFNPFPPLMTYGVPLLIRYVRKFTGSIRAGPVKLI